MKFELVCALCMIAASMVSVVQGATSRPTIGILSVPSHDADCSTRRRRQLDHQDTPPRSLRGEDDEPADDDKSDGSCFADMYVKWVEMAGGRAVPIPYDASEAHLQYLFNSVNGILFTGGGLSLAMDTKYYKAANYLYGLTLEAHKAGDWLPLHGTCMGFQLVCLLGAQNESVLTHNAFDSEDLSLPLDVTPLARKSRTFSGAPDNVWTTLTTQPVTTNLHHDGVEPTTFLNNERLNSNFDMLSTNKGRKGNEFVSTIESKVGPISATQWHPERPQFEWKVPLNISHTADAIVAMQYMGNLFVDQARKNDHAFPTEADLDAALIYNYDTTRGPGSYQVYTFPPSTV